jgi:hypothetical protein
MTLTTKDASILTQVAFKEAAAKSDVTTDEGIVEFDVRFAVLREKLFAAVAEETAKFAPAPSTVPPGRSAEQALVEELGASPMIEVVSDNGQQGSFPAWFVKAAAEAGVSRVYDNRDKLGENPKLPHFKCADTKKPFWPPKGGK